MATIDEDRSLEQLSHLILSQLHSSLLWCRSRIRSAINVKRKKKEWQRNCLEKRDSRDVKLNNLWIPGFSQKVASDVKVLADFPFKIKPYIISWTYQNHYAISIYISSFKAINRQFFPLILLLVIHLHLSQLQKYHFTSNVIPLKRSRERERDFAQIYWF